MHQLRRASIGLLAGALSLSLVGAASAAAPKHSVALTKGKSPFSDSLNIIAGSPSAVVYVSGPSWQRGGSGTQTMYVKNPKGKVRRLSPTPGQTVQSYQNFSIARNILVAYDGTTTSATWWNLTGKKHGVKKVPTGYQLLGASPDGWILANDTTDAIYDQAAAGHGKAKRIGVPFAKSEFKSISAATSGSTGIALRGESSMVYLKWGTKKFKKLSFNSSKVGISACTSLAGGALGCYGALSGKTGEYIFRIPLTGKPLVATKTPTKNPYPLNVSVSASSTAWTAKDITGLIPSFFSTSAKGHGVKKSKHVKEPAGYNQPGTAISAFGKFVVVEGTTRSLKLATVSNASSKPKPMVTAPLGIVHAASVSLTSNRVAYADDQKDYNAGDVWSRNLSGSSVGGASELIATSATSDGLSISGTTTADSESVTGKGKKAKPHIVVRIGSHVATIVGYSGQAAGTDVLYRNPAGKLEIYNGKTKKSFAPKLPAGFTSTYLDGKELLYIESDGSVWEVGLTKTAVPRMLVAAPIGFNYSISISGAGANVAWSEEVNDATAISYCVVTASTCTVKSATSSTTDQLDAATTNGVLLVASTTSPSGTSYGFTWALKPYSSKKARTVLSQTYSTVQYSSSGVGADSPIAAQVAVASGRIAWIDPSGGAHIGSLP